MSRAKAFSLLFAAAVLAAHVPAAQAQLTEYVWDSSKTGNQVWQQPANWTPTGFPDGPLHSANLSRPLGANLNVSVGTGVTVAGVKLGGTSTAVMTEISASPTGLLTFRNDEEPETPTANADFNGDSFVDGSDFLIWQRGLGASGQENNQQGDADASTVVDGADLQVWRDQFGLGAETFNVGSAFIESIGVAGSTNVISAGVHSNDEQIEIAGSTNLTINGAFTYMLDPADTESPGSDAALRVVRHGLTVTLNGGVAVADSDMDEDDDLRFNDIARSQGTLVINGVISGEGDLAIGPRSNAARLPLSTVVLNGNNTFAGGIRAGRGNLVLGHDNALGFNPNGPGTEDDERTVYRQAGPANQFGYNILSTDDARTIHNEMVIAQWQTFKGEHSLTWAGEISQTNNRGVINLLPAGKTLTFSGRVNIFDEGEPTPREFEFDGTGVTRVTGSIRDLPDDAMEPPDDHSIRKTGTGVLIIDVAAGDNSHNSFDIVDMGNLHYADNDSLNVGGGLILARGGAVGVDTGVSGNATFMARIDPTSRGGLMLAPTDAAANLDFTTTLANAANMTVAAPETGLTFTGSITPAGNKYQLGGGTGTLTLPGAQLIGPNSLEIRNGGTVQLLGDNAYTGATTILTKYSSTHEAQAAADSNDPDLSVGGTYYQQVAPTLVVDKLANGGQPSSIGSATNDAANLFIQGGTLRYAGAGDTTTRLFTIGTGGATIESSGTGPVVFSNTGQLGRDDAEDRTGTLDDLTGARTDNVIYEVDDTSDIIVGMSVTDPEGVTVFPPGLPAPRIPPGTVVTGISADGHEIGLSNSYGAILKPDTKIVFGTTPRTLTLGGSNAGANTLASLISNSTKGGVVGVTKTGAGTWILIGANTYTGATTVQQGTLNAVAMGGNLVNQGGVVAPAVGIGTLSVGGSFTQNAGSALAIELASSASFDTVSVAGSANLAGSIQLSLLGGFNPAVGSTFDILTASTLNVSGLTVAGPGGWSASAVGNTLRLTRTALASIASAAVPEPGASVLALLAAAAIMRRRGRRRV